MLYTPVPGTPLYEQRKKDGTILDENERPAADNHGQYRFNYRHEHIKDGQETVYLRSAFVRDFEKNGPSLARMIRTMLHGWKRYKNNPDPCIRKRMAWEIKYLKTTYAAAVWAMKRWYRDDHRMHDMIGSLLSDIYKEFGWKTRIIAPLLGIYAHASIKREQQRLADGWTYEPSVFYEKNAKAMELEALAKARSNSEPILQGTFVPNVAQN